MEQEKNEKFVFDNSSFTLASINIKGHFAHSVLTWCYLLSNVVIIMYCHEIKVRRIYVILQVAIYLELKAKQEFQMLRNAIRGVNKTQNNFECVHLRWPEMVGFKSIECKKRVSFMTVTVLYFYQAREMFDTSIEKLARWQC